MSALYCREESHLMLLSLLKSHGIRKMILSPGATNVPFVVSVQNDSDFELYSAPDERSAAYMACGMAEESQEPVVLSCTGATASRNYIPGLTEAFYRHIPILAVTETWPIGRIGHNIPQMMDRTNPLNDIARTSVQIPLIHSDEDRWSTEIQLNRAILELTHRDGGPAHINLTRCEASNTYETRELPNTRVIRRHEDTLNLPKIPKGKIAVFIGAHSALSTELTEVIDGFCATHNAVVICDHTSNYHGRYRFQANILSGQDADQSSLLSVDLLIHIGNISGAYIQVKPKRTWRVARDGELVDTFRKLTDVFEMPEELFFASYTDESITEHRAYIDEVNASLDEVYAKLTDLPFSNLWMAKVLSGRLPDNSVLHLGILNSLRSWNYFHVSDSIRCYSNTGGFGIDGCVSTLIGAALCDSDRLYYGVVGDLAFFYDMNSLGNRHVPNNLRLLVVNNGRGMEFRNYNHSAAFLGEDADRFVAAAGHYGCQSPDLLRHYAEDLGFEYHGVSSKAEFLDVIDTFTNPTDSKRPIIIESFTTPEEESSALRGINSLEVSAKGMAKQLAKDVLGRRGISAVKRLMGQ